GIYSDGPLTVTNSTFSANTAVKGGGGIFPGASATLKGTILGANGSSNCGGTITDMGYNISDDNSCGFAKTGSANNGDMVNPMLAVLAENGGPTQPIALQANSPAIDAIPFASCTDQALPPNQLATDQRGFDRPDPGDGPSGPCDIGAYESGHPTPIP